MIVQLEKCLFLYLGCETNKGKFVGIRKDILLIESLKDYVKVITPTRFIVSKQSISSLEEMLPKDSFIRVHRSYIIAVNKIDSYNTDLIEIGDKQIPIGRLFRHEVSRVLNLSSIKNTNSKQSMIERNNGNDTAKKNDSYPGNI